MHTNSLKLQQLIQRGGVKAGDLKKIKLSVSIKKVDKDRQIVTGEVYAPYLIDSHGDMMEPEDVEFMAHEWIANGLTESYDVMHDNKVIKARTVESWIARGHPDWNEGAWVLGTKILDKSVWAGAKSGQIGGYSIEALVHKVPAIVEYSVEPQIFGFTEPHSDHDHAFFAFVNADGVVTGGYTSKDNGHRHIIRYGTRTEVAKGHTHRFFLP